MIDDSGPMGMMECMLSKYYDFDTVYKIPEVGLVQRSHIRAFGDRKTCETAQVRFEIKDYKIHKLPNGQHILIDMQAG